MTKHELVTQGANALVSAPVIPVLSPRSVDDMYSMNRFEAVAGMALRFAQSKLYGNITEQQAFVVLQAGIDLGISPTAAMSGIHIIQGKATMAGQLMVGLINRDGHRFEILHSDGEKAHVKITRKEGHSHEVVFTSEDAKRADLAGKDTWKKFPRQMRLNRAISECARYFCPESLNGIIYTPEDFNAVVADTGEVIAADPTPVQTLGNTEPSAINPSPMEWSDEDAETFDFRRSTLINISKELREPDTQANNRILFYETKKKGCAEPAAIILAQMLDSIKKLQAKQAKSLKPSDPPVSASAEALWGDIQTALEARGQTAEQIKASTQEMQESWSGLHPDDRLDHMVDWLRIENGGQAC